MEWLSRLNSTYADSNLDGGLLNRNLKNWLKNRLNQVERRSFDAKTDKIIWYRKLYYRGKESFRYVNMWYGWYAQVRDHERERICVCVFVDNQRFFLLSFKGK